MKKFAAFDIDGTLVRWQLFHAVTSVLLQQNTNKTIYDRIIKARTIWKKRIDPESFRSYEKMLILAYDDMLVSLPPAKFDEVVMQIFEEHKDQVYTYTRDFVKSLKTQGYFLIAISGSQIEIVEKVAKYYGFDDAEGTVFEQKDGKFTGKKTVASKDKQALLTALIDKHSLTLEGSIAVGDSESDIPMLAMVENPIAFNPTKALFETAKAESWKVVVERKNMVYELLPTQRGNNGSFVLV